MPDRRVDEVGGTPSRCLLHPADLSSWCLPAALLPTFAVSRLLTPGAGTQVPDSVFAAQLDSEHVATRRELGGRMTVLLGGRAAELVAFGELSTGAADDLVKATELAREELPALRPRAA